MTHVTDEETRICPSCARGFDVPLILPCSHTLCGRCLTGGAGPDRHRGGASSSHPVVLCPNCRHGVELPCFDWSSALTCLPLDPTVTFDPTERGKREEQRWETGECRNTAYCFLKTACMGNSVLYITISWRSPSCRWQRGSF